MKVNGVAVSNPSAFSTYSQWLARSVAEGRQMVHYACPVCVSVLFGMVPPVGEASDTFSTCPVCAGVFFKIVDNENGLPVVSVHAMPTGKEDRP